MKMNTTNTNPPAEDIDTKETAEALPQEPQPPHDAQAAEHSSTPALAQDADEAGTAPPQQPVVSADAGEHLKKVDLGMEPEGVVAPEEDEHWEEEVFGDVVGYGFSDDEIERYFRSPKWNAGWQQHKAPFLQPEQKAEREAFWKQVLTGDVSTIPQHIRKKLTGDAEKLTQEEEDYQLLTAVNRSWLVDHLGVSRQEAQRAWPVYRERLARRLEVADTDEDVFLALSERENEKPLRKVAADVYELAYKVGIEGRREYDLTPYLNDLDAYRADNVRGLATKGFEEGSAKRRKYMPLAQTVRFGLKSVTAWEKGIKGIMPTLNSLPDFWESVKQLAHLTRDERNEVYHIVRSISPAPQPDDENLLDQMLAAARRSGVTNVLMMDQALVQTAGAWMRILGKSLGKHGKNIHYAAEKMDKYSIIVEELRRLSHDELAPLLTPGSRGLIGQMMVDISSAIPDVIMSYMKHPVVGVVRAVSGIGSNTMDVRLRAPHADPDTSLTAGALGMLAQRGTESILSKIGGDKLANAISRLLRVRGGGLRKYVMPGKAVSDALAFELLRELMVEKGGQASNYLTQEVMMKCRNTATNIDWRQFGNSILDVNMNIRTAMAELPFILIGAGHVALRDFNAPQHLLKHEGEALKSWGISDADRKKIVEETDVDKQGEMLRDALRDSSRWGGGDFLRRAARALGLLNFDYFTEFKDRSFLCDFLKLPPVSEERTKKGDAENADKTPPEMHADGIFRLQQHTDLDYQNQLVELWRDTWKKAHYADAATHLPNPEWDVCNVKSPSERRLALYINEILKSPKSPLPRRILRDGLYAPYAERDRTLLLRDRVEDVRNLSHLMALHALSVDSGALARVPIEDMKQHAEEARQRYVGSIVGAVLRIKRGEDREKVLSEVEQDLLQTIRTNLQSLPEVPMWWLHASTPGENILPRYETKRVHSWKNWLKNPELVDVYRLCAGTRANIRMLADLLPLSNDYYTAISVGMTPLQAYNHLLLRELPCDTEKIPNYPHAELAQNVAAEQYADFCAENNRIFTLTQQMFGNRLLQDTGEHGQPLWAVRRPDGTQSPWHSTKQQAINDYVTNAQTYFQKFNVVYFGLLGYRVGRFRSVEGHRQEWLRRQNPFIGHDQIMSHASRDMLTLMDERAAFLQPGLFVDRNPNRYNPINDDRDDGISPLFSAADALSGRYEVNQFSVLSPVAYLQSRMRVFWERMMKSKRIDSKRVERFLNRVELEFPLMKEALERYFPDPNTISRIRWSRNRTSTLSNKMAVYSTCYLLANPHEMEMPDSVRLWLQLTPMAPLVNDAKPINEYQNETRRSVARGLNDRTIMTWVSRKSSEKLRHLAPMLESLRDKPFFSMEQDGKIRELFDMSLGKDPVVQLEQGWMQLLCGETVLRSVPQRWLNFLYNPRDGWFGLSFYEKYRLASFMSPLLHPERKAAPEDADAMADDVVDVDTAKLSDVKRLKKAVFEISSILRLYPHLRQYGYLDANDPHASMLMIDRKMPKMERLEEPDYDGLPLYPGKHVVSPTVVPYGKFSMDANAPRGVEKTLALMSRLRMFPISRPILKDGNISWKGVVYGGREGKTPLRLNDWIIDDNPLAPLLQMRDRMETIEDLDLYDKVANVELLYNYILPSYHDEVFGNVTVYRNPAKVHDMCRLMPGEFFAHHPNVSNPYVVQCTRGAYIYRRQMADTPELMAQAMQPLENFRPWGDQNRTEESINRGRMAAIRKNLELVVQHPFSYDNEDSPINVSPREMLMRLAVDTGFLNTLKDAYPEQVDYGNALTYSLVNALYEYSCHPNLPETRSALRNITSRLNSSEEDYGLVLRVLREAARSQTKPNPAAAQFESLRPESRGETAATDAVAQRKDDKWLPVIKLPRANDISRIEQDEDMDFGPVDIDESTLPPLELMQFDFSDENGSAAQSKIWAPQKIGEEHAPQEPAPESGESARRAPLLKAVETDNAEIWGDLFKFKFPGMKHADKSSANPPRPPKNTQGFFDFGDES